MQKLPWSRRPASAHPPSDVRQPASHRAAEGPRNVGKYLVSPLIKVLENGWFASAVSIRSGSGSGTTDRVLRFARLFPCPHEATDYAHAEALHWIGASRGASA